MTDETTNPQAGVPAPPPQSDDPPDDPNRQLVRPDGSPAWAVGNGGSTWPESGEQSVEPSASMTKAQLLEEADARGVDADDSMTKAQILEALG
jgi:hypothetical protein